MIEGFPRLKCSQSPQATFRGLLMVGCFFRFTKSLDIIPLDSTNLYDSKTAMYIPKYGLGKMIWNLPIVVCPFHFGNNITDSHGNPWDSINFH